MTRLLLTDDELAAACLTIGRAWPYSLPTVPPDAAELANAIARGRRSLIVRSLVGEGRELDPDLTALVGAATSAAQHVVSYVAPARDLSELAGSSTYVFIAKDGSAVLDLVSASGVHELSSATSSEALDVVVSLIENAFHHGFRGAHGDARLVSIGIGDERTGLVTVQGRIAVGRFATADTPFLEDQVSETWDRALVQSTLGAKAA